MTTIISNLGISVIYPIARTNKKEARSSIEKLASRFIPYYDKSRKFKNLVNKINNDSNYVVKEKDLSIINFFINNGNKNFTKNLIKDLTSIASTAIEAILSPLNDSKNEKKIHSTLEKFLQLLDKDTLSHLMNLTDEEIRSALKTQSHLKNEALKGYLQTKGKAIWREVSHSTTYFFHHIIEMFISLTGLTEVGGGRKSRFGSNHMDRYEAKTKLEFYIFLLAYPSLVFTTIFAILQSLALPAAAAIAGVMTCVALISSLAAIPIYIRYLRPCPNHFEGLDNLNQKAIENENPPIFKRRNLLKRIQDAFLKGKGVILTAQTGVGKTTIINSLAESIVSKECFDFLLKAQLFSVNANQLTAMGMDTLSLNSLSEHFNRHKKEFVLFLDEIESIFKENKISGKVSESLLTFQDKFKFIICATTTDQYNNTIKDHEDAFNRRFIHIEAEPLTKQELKIALDDFLHYKAPELILEKGVISYIMDKGLVFNPKTSQVDGSMSLLSCAIVKATPLSFDQLEQEINDLKVNIESFTKNYLHSLDYASAEEIEQHEKHLKSLKEKESELAKKQNDLERIKKIESLCLKIKRSNYRLAPQALKNDLKLRKWMINQTCHKFLSEHVGEKRNELGFPSCLNKELVEQIIEESQNNGSSRDIKKDDNDKIEDFNKII